MKVLFKYLKVLIISILLMQSSCKNNLVGPISYSSQESSLYLSLDGNNNAGLYILNPNSFDLMDSLVTGRGVPFTVVFSKDYSKFYSSWKDYSNNQAYIYCVDNKTMSILQQVSIGNVAIFLSQNKDKTNLIGYLEPLSIYDIESLSPIYEDKSGAITFHVKCSSKQDICYLTQIINGVFTGLTIYNLNSNKIEKIIPIANETEWQFMEPADLDISPDEHYAFVSVFKELGFGGYNSLFVIDLITSEVIGEYATGAFAQLCVSPDGHYLYISDPAGYLRQIPSTNQILRYDIVKGSMEIFLKLSDLGLSGSTLVTDKMAITSDSRILFVSTSGDIKDSNGNWVNLLKVDLGSKSILKTYSLPLDSLGRQIRRIVNIKLAH